MWTHCEFQSHNGDLSVKGETGSVKGETKSANFLNLARESVTSSPIVRIFGKGKCEFIANFSATMVTSLPSISLSLSLSLYLSLSLSPSVPHAQYRKRFRASYNTKGMMHLCMDHSSRGSCHLKEGERTKPEGEKNFWQLKVWTHCEFQRHHGDLSVKGETGSVEGRNEKCEFLARESVSSSPIVRIFGKGKCKLIANFSAKMVTSLPSFSLSLCISLSLSLSLSPKVPHAQYRKRFRASYNTPWLQSLCVQYNWLYSNLSVSCPHNLFICWQGSKNRPPSGHLRLKNPVWRVKKSFQWAVWRLKAAF